MKTIRHTIVMFCLLMIGLSYGQNEICTNFESGSFDGWQNRYSTSSINSPALDGTNYLRVRDGSGGSWVYNSTSYPKDWKRFIDHCLCFDYKVFNDGIASSSANINPKIVLYDGASPQASTVYAVFVATNTVTENDDWVHVCAPILPSDGVTLPGNGDGQWTNVTPAQWNALLSNVGGVAFAIDIAGSSAQTEIIGVDNICIQDCNNVEPPSNEGSYCCDGENLVVNGNFEFGNSGFNSSYSNNPAVYPGQYDVTNSASAFGATVTDHSFCADPIAYATNDDFMIVNGKTQQSGNAVIWQQTISGLERGARYKFCANFKNMPQCTFDILPRINMIVSGSGATGFSAVSVNPADPCDWDSREYNFTASSSSVSLRIVLDQTGNGDGNDLAIDDIAVTKLIDPNLSITVQHQGNPQEITGSINTISPSDDSLHGSDCEYYWFVSEVTSYPPIVVSGPAFASGNASGNSLGASPWNLTTTFPDYNFNQNTMYIVGMYTPECGCYDEGFTYQLTYNNRPMGDDMTEEQKQLIIYWILNGYKGPANTSQDVGSNNLLIYPNPVENSFNVSLIGDSLKSVEILSLTGQSILSKKFKDGKTEETLDISSFAAGIYLVKAYGLDNKQFTAKLVKK
ncbi:hypothetical protein Aeqsu_2338 [Aequorivita sublithincola DSM 14238]|uniref:Secretion system C-terminal sorting domain-containing protein n=1 Tax=Aequorivita sublithincola (strain DSM 14238 / LMG 21431 / ACAM 643 / 9-3) TaxID=746697 RepID=I3YXT0_AEQSU|nr:T9SS type A sorting domain-containing protein [Aequorivita sublithincola]AFL81798.1 hypothetical protein Aeqsu_2338 [Aequorivita sublithincola DSM 14238]